MKSLLMIFLFVGIAPQLCFAWGKRGHEIVSSVAARLLVEKKGLEFLRNHEFDFGYYANVPDIIWKNLGEETRHIEEPTHFLDWGPKFEKVFGSPDKLPSKFGEFKSKLGDKYNPKDGMVLWRIQSLLEKCKKLKQGPQLACAGEVSHYTGDLSQPLHVTENYDGQMTGQKGIHAYFESDVINLLDPELKTQVLEKALKLFDVEKKLELTSAQRIRKMVIESYSKVPEVLKKDKRGDRQRNLKNALEFKELAVDQLAAGAVLTALLWEEVFYKNMNFEVKGFYFFDGAPKYIQPDFLKGE